MKWPPERPGPENKGHIDMSTNIKPLFDYDNISVRLHIDDDGDVYLYASSGSGAVTDFLDSNSFLTAVITEFGADRIREALGDASVEVESPDRYTVPRDYDEAMALWDSLGEDQPEFYSKGEVWMSVPRETDPFFAFTVDGQEGKRVTLPRRRLYTAPKDKRPEWADAEWVWADTENGKRVIWKRLSGDPVDCWWTWADRTLRLDEMAERRPVPVAREEGRGSDGLTPAERATFASRYADGPARGMSTASRKALATMRAWSLNAGGN